VAAHQGPPDPRILRRHRRAAGREGRWSVDAVSAQAVPPEPTLAAINAYLDRFDLLRSLDLGQVDLAGLSAQMVKHMIDRHRSFSAIRWVSPSLPFVMLCGRRFCGDRPVGRGALARRFFETGACPAGPELVPVSAWIDSCGPETLLLEHSVANRQHGAVMTILWDPTDVAVTRPATATLPFVTSRVTTS
jgi:hypothetical protein